MIPMDGKREHPSNNGRCSCWKREPGNTHFFLYVSVILLVHDEHVNFSCIPNNQWRKKNVARNLNLRVQGLLLVMRNLLRVSSYTSSVSQNARLGLAWQTVGAHLMYNNYMDKCWRKWIMQQRMTRRENKRQSPAQPANTRMTTKAEKAPTGYADILVWPLESPKVLFLLLPHPQIKANQQTKGPRISPLPKICDPQTTVQPPLGRARAL